MPLTEMTTPGQGGSGGSSTLTKYTADSTNLSVTINVTKDTQAVIVSNVISGWGDVTLNGTSLSFSWVGNNYGGYGLGVTDILNLTAGDTIVMTITDGRRAMNAYVME